MSNQDVAAQFQQSVGQLVDLDESELLLELGRRLVETGKEMEGGTQTLAAAQPAGPSLDKAELAGPVEFVQRAAVTFLRRFNRQLYSLVCDPADPDNHIIKTALESGTQNVGLVLGGVLVASFGWLPGVATVIAAIIVKRLMKASHTAVCETWKESLEE